jgi:hypothetical protein
LFGQLRAVCGTLLCRGQELGRLSVEAKFIEVVTDGRRDLARRFVRSTDTTQHLLKLGCGEGDPDCRLVRFADYCGG